MTRWRLLGALSLAAMLLGCSDARDDEPTEPGLPHPEEIFGATITTVELEVAYASGAAPVTGNAGKEDDAWNITELNLDALFAGSKALRVPHALDEMAELGTLDGGPYEKSELLELADGLRRRTREDTVTLYVLFVDGFYEEDGERDDSVIGIHFGTSGVIAMFKPALDDNGKLTAVAEQSTLVHEVGHAVGLVNDGLPLTADHHDADHGSHCTRTECVMYYALEGKKTLMDFAKTHEKSAESLFGPDCLADAAAAITPP